MVAWIQIYQTRWTTEVFFKEAKQLLDLSKCQSKDFDAQIVDATITMIQYILLTLKYRYEKYESKGKLYQEIEEKVYELRLNERLCGLFVELLKLINEIFKGVDEEELIATILNNESVYVKITSLLIANEEKIAA